MRTKNKLFVSVDMDEWYQCRWATGSANALWPDLESCWQEVYGSPKPGREIEAALDKVLELFNSLDFKSTFFFTGVVAGFYPNLVKKIAALGHEIACHNHNHEDYEYTPRENFWNDLIHSKKFLEDLIGTPIIGYRSPNSSIPPTLVPDLEKAGFLYDSSVTPTRRYFGKWGSFLRAPRKPYRPDYFDISKEGTSKLWEFPWAVLPFLKLPAGSGITHRIMGNLFNRIAIIDSLNKGHTAYYFHPYEIHDSEILNNIGRRKFTITVFLRDAGTPYYHSLHRLLKSYRTQLISGRDLLQLCESSQGDQ